MVVSFIGCGNRSIRRKTADQPQVTDHVEKPQKTTELPLVTDKVEKPQKTTELQQAADKLEHNPRKLST